MIFVAGGNGFLGKNLCKKLEEKNIPYLSKSLRDGLDYRNYSDLRDYLKSNNVEYIINCAAFVGGIQFGYKHQGEMFFNNLRMTLNFLELSRELNLKRVVNPISNCAYPAKSTLFKEDEFWDGPLHESVLPYGFARKASWVGSWAYNKQYETDWINLVFSNMYGPYDHFDEERSHALGALVMKIVKANEEGLPEVVIWGTGKPIREWVFVEDGVEAMIRALHIKGYNDIINVGIGKGISIIDLAILIKEIVGYKGALVLDESKPDGAPYKTVEGTTGQKLLKWKPQTDLKEGIKKTINWYKHER